MKKKLSHLPGLTKTDPLTGLGNDRAFAADFRHTINSSNAPAYCIVYAALDMNNILTYLDANAADSIECRAASTISAALATGEFAARFGAGLYACALHCETDAHVIARVDVLLAALNACRGPLSNVREHVFHAGIYRLPDATITPELALANAKWGYTYAERQGKALCFSDLGSINEEAMREQIRKRIIHAVHDRAYSLYLQFIVSASDGHVIGAEALSRWKDPKLGTLPPGQFIDELVSVGLIDRLDYYMLEQSCRVLEQWTRAGHSLWISCNVTRTTAAAVDFGVRVGEILSRYDFPREYLIIELTEAPRSKDRHTVCRGLTAVHAMGCRLALDDLGTGFSSFSDLCDYPIDIIKIDRHLTEKSIEARGCALLGGLIRLAHDMNLEVLCEGVETLQEKETVCSLGCDYIQGFLYFHAIPLADAEAYIARSDRPRPLADAIYDAD